MLSSALLEQLPPRLHEAVRRRRRHQLAVRLDAAPGRGGRRRVGPDQEEVQERASSCGWTAARATRTRSTSSRTARAGGRVQADRHVRPRHPDQRAPAQDRRADEPRRLGPRACPRRKGAPAGQVQHAHRLPGGAGRADVPEPRRRSSPPSWARPTPPCPTTSRIGGRSYGAGFLGPKYQPLLVTDADKGVEDLKAAVTDRPVQQPARAARPDGEGVPRRVQGRRHHRPQDDLRAGRQADALEGGEGVRPGRWSRPRPAASTAPASSPTACLMARRLVEVGVPFVEVILGGWDTHLDNFDAGEGAVRAGRFGASAP